MGRRDPNTLPLDGDPGGGPSRGTVYHDVCHQIAHLRQQGSLDADAEAGTIAQARSLAAVIDRASGLGGRKQETYALASLHRELRELLAILADRPVDDDELDGFTIDDAAPDLTPPEP